ncbi:MAG: XRE family transcriptional regulator [Crocinitomicaceae bacterium]|jgi:transcriptional regulator with XRE-family HTH domain
MFISKNLKALRKRLKKSQEEVAQELNMHRSTYSGYENEVATPNIENLLIFSKYYQISIDDLIQKDLSGLTAIEWERFSNEWKTQAKGSNLRVLTSVVDQQNDEVIELIPEKARAGYVAGFSDPEFVRELPSLHLPFLSKNKKYRAFPISGDSMPPVVSGSFVVGEFVQDWTTIKNGTPCVLVSKEEGIVFKFLYSHLDDNQTFLLVSSNPNFEPYSVHISEVLEIWKFVSYISSEIPNVRMDEHDLSTTFRNLHQDIFRILNRIDSKA